MFTLCIHKNEENLLSFDRDTAPHFLDFLFQNLIEKIGTNVCEKINLSKMDDELIPLTT